MRVLITLCILFFSVFVQAQKRDNPVAEKNWVDSVYASLNPEQRIGQLIIARVSSIDSKTRKISFYDSLLKPLVSQYNIGGICLFQGDPVKQAGILNELQNLAKTPILVSMDAEWGVAMRLTDHVTALPRQMMLGALTHDSLVYAYGQRVAAQCRRMGIHLNYAPVVDINNNPNNPVINDRSFGENKYKVAQMGIAYMKGLQDAGVMACAKHFPGHGDVAVDSHHDLPVIYKNIQTLRQQELFPFRAMVDAGVGSVMVGHLFIPAIDSRSNRPTSLSEYTIEGLLRNSLGFQGLTVTDALEMQGVKKFFPDGEAAVQSVLAGNDMLCLPENIPLAIRSIQAAIQRNELSWSQLETRVKRVLQAKYRYVIPYQAPVDTTMLQASLNEGIIPLRKKIAEQSVTLLSHQDGVFFPLRKENGNIAYVGMGLKNDNTFASMVRREYMADIFYMDYKPKDSAAAAALLDSIVLNYRKIIIGVHQLGRSPANNFGLSDQAVRWINALQRRAKTITIQFGNAYAARNWCYAPNLVVAYEDDSVVHRAALDLLAGRLTYEGNLPVTVCEKFEAGAGFTGEMRHLPKATPVSLGLNAEKLAVLDTLAMEAIRKKATPGCQVLVLRGGHIAYEKSFGFYTYSGETAVQNRSQYDLASITKIAATTLGIMYLTEQGLISLQDTLGKYLPITKGTDKAGITLESLLLHEAGLSPFIPFHRQLPQGMNEATQGLFRTYSLDSFCVPVAGGLFMREDWADTMYQVMVKSPLSEPGRYVYSDNDFIFLGKVLESVTGQPLDEWVALNFYRPMGLEDIGYLPLNRLSLDRIVPTEFDKQFRNQLLQGYVHDPGAAMFGGVAGHAGLFGNAYELGCLMQMLLSGGYWQGTRYLMDTTIQQFTSYKSGNSRRGLGFDKPEQNNATRPEAYPARSASASTFGHTGFTGTAVWADPEQDLVFVFLSNRVHPDGSNLLNQLNIRTRMLQAVYDALER